jgi:hypothetical protein
MRNPSERVPVGKRPGLVLALFALVMLILYGLQQTLVLPADGALRGIEDLMGSTNAGDVQAALLALCHDGAWRWLLAVVYLMVDTAWFMPLYGALFLMANLHLARLLRVEAPRFAWWMRAAGSFFLLLLWLLDAWENAMGLWVLRGLGWPLAAAGLGSLIACVGLITGWVWPRAPAAAAGAPAHVVGVWPLRLGLAGALIGLTGWLGCVLVAQGGQLPTAGMALTSGQAWPHAHKVWFVAAALAPALIMFAVWWFGMAARGATALRRARYRAGVMGVLGRSRYVLLAIAAFAGFTLVMDQCRDVLRANAGWEAVANGATPVASWVWAGLVLASSLGATFLLSHSCWQWTRLASVVEGAGAVRSPPGTRKAVGKFVQLWARTLAMLPLLIVCVLTFTTLGETLLMAPVLPAAAHAALNSTLTWLVIFAVGACVLGGAMLWWRQRQALGSTAMYYDNATDMASLLRGALPGRQASQVWWASVMTPAGLPVAALVCMLLLRAVQALMGMDATAGMPPTFAVVTLGVCWWLGVAGLTSVAEHRWGIPLGLVFVVAIVMASGDNHVLPLYARFVGASEPSAPAELASSTGQLWVMLLTCVAVWAALALAVRRDWRRAGAWGLVVGVLVVLVNGPWQPTAAEVDAGTSSIEQLPPTASGGVAAPPAVPASATVAAAGQGQRPVLVAAEGGGMRSAYWTALVLARLDAQQQIGKGGDVVLSGVSGGSVGEAIYVACRRQVHRGRQGDVLSCVQDQAGKLDALTPLLAGLVFEDALSGTTLGSLARSIGGGAPASRARPMEYALTQAWPGLQEPLTPASADEPLLLFNTTWVETGRRAVLSNRALNDPPIPELVDLLSPAQATVKQAVSDGASGVAAPALPSRDNVSLITAAHASARFPVVNPVAAFPAGTPGARKGGHLVDGGYNENSATGSVDAVWRARRSGQEAPPVLFLIRNGVKSDPKAPKNLLDALLHPEPPESTRLAVGWLGPVMAAYNVIGLTAQAQQATVQLVHAVKSQRGIVCVIDQQSGEVAAPLGWYLSGLTRQWMNKQAEDQVKLVLAALQGGSDETLCTKS